MRQQKKELTQERLREIAWEVGGQYPIPLTADYIALSMVHPHLGHVHWHIHEESLVAIKVKYGEAFNYVPLIIRVYDVTDVIFDGLNAHSFFDLQVGGLNGNYYFAVPQLGRTYLAEIGLRAGDGTYRLVARSNSIYIDRDRPVGNYQIEGLFVGGTIKRQFPVENIFDARIYERINRELAGIDQQELSVAMIFIGFNSGTSPDSSLGRFIANCAQRLNKFGVEVQLFMPLLEAAGNNQASESLFSNLEALSKTVFEQLRATHQEQPFHLIHCHDWYSAQAGLAAATTLKLPLVFSLHSTEHERAQGYQTSQVSPLISRWEKEAAQAASLVIVPHSSTRQQVVSLYETPAEKVVIIPDVLDGGGPSAPPNPAEVKGWFGLNPDAPLVLFAGEISHAAGADLLMDALPVVCGGHGTVQFVFAGEGPLKGELESRSWQRGIGQRCRFLGDVSSDTFRNLLMAAEFVVIPARTWQGEGLAQLALDCGKPVLTTHQAGIHSVVHGQNGLVTYDNPGSIVWGLQEMLANPLHGSMLRLAARRKSDDLPTLETVAAQHFMYYEIALENYRGGSSA